MKTSHWFLIPFLVCASLAQASDSWDNCSSADGLLQIEYGTLVVREENANEAYQLVKLIKKIPIKTRKETCQLKNTRRTVLSIDERVAFEVYELKNNNTSFKVDFLCARGGSGIPANDECDENTTKMVETYLVK